MIARQVMQPPVLCFVLRMLITWRDARTFVCVSKLWFESVRLPMTWANLRIYMQIRYFLPRFLPLRFTFRDAAVVVVDPIVAPRASILRCPVCIGWHGNHPYRSKSETWLRRFSPLNRFSPCTVKLADDNLWFVSEVLVPHQKVQFHVEWSGALTGIFVGLFLNHYKPENLEYLHRVQLRRSFQLYTCACKLRAGFSSASRWWAGGRPIQPCGISPVDLESYITRHQNFRSLTLTLAWEAHSLSLSVGEPIVHTCRFQGLPEMVSIPTLTHPVVRFCRMSHRGACVRVTPVPVPLQEDSLRILIREQLCDFCEFGHAENCCCHCGRLYCIVHAGQCSQCPFTGCHRCLGIHSRACALPGSLEL